MHRYTLKKNIILAILGAAIGLPVAVCANAHHAQPEIARAEPVIYEELGPSEDSADPLPVAYEMTEEELAEESYYDSLEVLAALVHAEAGNQDMIGKRLVAEVVLNRVESESFPDTVRDVIFQPRQFAPVWDGALDRAIPTEEDFEAVRLAIGDRLDPAILYFTGGGYGKYGTPAFKHGDHYFCTE